MQVDLTGTLYNSPTTSARLLGFFEEETGSQPKENCDAHTRSSTNITKSFLAKRERSAVVSLTHHPDHSLSSGSSSHAMSSDEPQPSPKHGSEKPAIPPKPSSFTHFGKPPPPPVPPKPHELELAETTSGTSFPDLQIDTVSASDAPEIPIPSVDTSQQSLLTANGNGGEDEEKASPNNTSRARSRSPSPGPSSSNTVNAYNAFINNDGDITDIIASFEHYRAEAEGEIVEKGMEAKLEKLIQGSTGLPRDFATLMLATAGSSYTAKALFDLLESRFRDPVYTSRKAPSCDVLAVGAGPAGLRAAVEARFFRSTVKVVEKRNSFTRNNVLHLWPWTMTDLRKIGVKQVFSRFGTGGIDHVAIRRLQLILLKIALILGAEVHPNVSFEWAVDDSVIPAEPSHDDTAAAVTTESDGATQTPVTSPPPARRKLLAPKFSDPSLDSYPFNVLLCATGEHSKLTSALGFQRQGFRPTQAIGITCNFKRAEKVDLQMKDVKDGGYISYLNKKWFGEIESTTGVALENLVFYKDETHYLVMCIREANLLSQGVLKEDFETIDKILAPSNIDRGKLQECVRNVATAVGIPPQAELMPSTKPNEPDVAIFDFSEKSNADEPSMLVRFPQDNPEKVILACPLGDSLLEPFWPLGTGCAHAGLSAMDAMWIAAERFEPLLADYTKGGFGAPAPGSAIEIKESQLLQEHAALFRALKASTADTTPSGSDSSIDPKTRYVGKVAEAKTSGVAGQKYSQAMSFSSLSEPDRVPLEAATEPGNEVEVSEEEQPEPKRARTG